MSEHEFKRGDQIFHTASQQAGFIIRVNWKIKIAYCRFWRSRRTWAGLPIMRTKSCSESVPIRLLVMRDTVPQEQVEEALRQLESDQVNEFMEGLNDAS